MKNYEYRYKVELRYPYQDKEIELDSTNIKVMAINYDCISYNTPIIYLKMELDRNIIDDMIENQKNKYITLKISKYQNNTKFTLYENYINDQFIYFLDNNALNGNKELDYSHNTKDSKDVYKSISIGLVKQSLIDNNKIVINGFFRNTSLINILLCYLTHMKLVIQPRKNNDCIGDILIPPIHSVTEFLKYLNSQYVIYDTPYRFFMDFNRTYLLSSDGTGVPVIGEKYNTVIFNVISSNKLQGKTQGMREDPENKAYIIDIDTNDISLVTDKASGKVYDTIIGIDSNGNTTTEKIDSSTTNNTRIIRTNNLEQIKNIKNSIDINTIKATISKTELDTTIFTFNKEYYINNYDRLNKRGKFILTTKKEIYTRDGDNFVLSSVFTLSKVN